MTVHSAAFVGTVGGCGTTRLAVETGAALARAGRRVLVLDLAVDTQGLASRVGGRISPDSTQLLTDPDVALADAVHDAALDTPGDLVLCPAHAPFTRVAEAKTPEAARRLDGRLTDARAAGYDAVILDTPPVASNPAVAAVTSADRTVLVASPDERGVDAIQRARGRLTDVGTKPDLVAMPRSTPAAAPPDADLVVPDAPTAGPAAGPDALGTTPFADALVHTAETVFETDLGLDDQPTGRLQSLRQRLS